MVATDRMSAFDQVLATIPDKGRVLTALSRWWFEQLAEVVPHHLLLAEESAGLVPDEVSERALAVRRLQMYPIECVARGYLTGSELLKYLTGRVLSGVPLPGLVDGSRLPEPIFTPAAKAKVGEHDENVTFEQVTATIGADEAATLRELTLAVYRRAETIARDRGLVLADTKLEFGRDESGQVVLGDEALTPDSSRFWPAELWAPGGSQRSFGRQILRDWLLSPASGWDRHGDAPPPLPPDDVVQATRNDYIEAYERLTGAPLPSG